MEIFGLSVLALIGILVAFVLLIVSVNLSNDEDDTEGYGWPSAIVVLAFVGFMYWADEAIIMGALKFIKENTISFIGYIVVYFVIGLFWSFFKWGRFLDKTMKRLIKIGKTNKCISEMRPKPEKNSAMLSLWITYWPVSLFWFILSDPFIKIGAYISTKFTGVYEKMSKSKWDKALENIEKK